MSSVSGMTKLVNNRADAFSRFAASVTFGSIDDVSAPLSSSPASVPPIKAEAPKTFGSVNAQATTISAVNGKPSPASSSSTVLTSAAKPSTPSSAKFDVKKLFQGNSSGPSSSSSSQPPSDSVSSPSTRPAPLPQHPSPQASSSHAPQSSQYNSHSFQTFVPGSGLRPSPNGTNASGPPRSPVYPRQTPNGTTPPTAVNGRPQGGPGSSPAPPTPMSANMPSPRMAPPHAGQPPAMQPGQVPWTPYYVCFLLLCSKSFLTLVVCSILILACPNTCMRRLRGKCPMLYHHINTHTRLVHNPFPSRLLISISSQACQCPLDTRNPPSIPLARRR